MKQGCKLWGGEKRERVLMSRCGREILGGLVKEGDIMKMQTFLLSLSPQNICLSNEEIWRYYILLFGDIGSVGTMEYGKYVASGEECDQC